LAGWRPIAAFASGYRARCRQRTQEPRPRCSRWRSLRSAAQPSQDHWPRCVRATRDAGLAGWRPIAAFGSGYRVRCRQRTQEPRNRCSRWRSLRSAAQPSQDRWPRCVRAIRDAGLAGWRPIAAFASGYRVRCRQRRQEPHNRCSRWRSLRSAAQPSQTA